MKMIENLKNFLEDKDYYIDIYDDKLHIFNYKKLLKLSDNNINLKLENFILEITGDNLRINSMNDTEILISGNINIVRIQK